MFYILVWDMKKKYIPLIAVITVLVVFYFALTPKLGRSNKEVIEFNVGGKCYVELIKFKDDINSEKNEFISDVDCDVIGDYTGTVKVKSLFGTREHNYMFKVVDKESPVIEARNEDGPRKVVVGYRSNDYVCYSSIHVSTKVTDNYDEEIKSEVVNKINVCDVGVHEYVEVATDSSGNSSEFKLEVEIIDNPLRYTNTEEVIIFADVLNVRESGNPDSEQVGEVFKDEVYKVLEETHDFMNRPWYKIITDEFTGWIASWYTVESTVDIDSLYRVTDHEVGHKVNGITYKDVSNWEHIAHHFNVKKWVKLESHDFNDSDKLTNVVFDEKLFKTDILLDLEWGGVDVIYSDKAYISTDYSLEYKLKGLHPKSDIDIYIDNCDITNSSYHNIRLFCVVSDYRVSED